MNKTKSVEISFHFFWAAHDFGDDFEDEEKTTIKRKQNKQFLKFEQILLSTKYLMKCITLYVVGAFDKNVWCSESKELHWETQPRFGTKIDVNWKAIWVQLFIFFVLLIFESKSKSYMFCLSKFELNLSIFTISLFGERT